MPNVEVLPKNIVKRLLGNYVATGESNTSELKPGEKHQFMATFYKGQHYRIAVCSDESLGNIQFTIRNAKRQLYFDNHGEAIKNFDFRVLHLLNNLLFLDRA